MKKGNLTSAELSIIFQEMAFLIRAGANVGSSLALLAAQETDREMKAILAAAAERMDMGTPLTDALRSVGGFPGYALGLLETGEQTGHLEECLSSLSGYYRERERIAELTRSALAYPALLLVLILLVVGVLLIEVLPVFDEVYRSLGGQLTGAAGVLLAAGEMLGRLLPVFGALLVLVCACVLAVLCSGTLRGRVSAFWQSRFGDQGVSRRMNDAHCAQVMALGFGSGLPVEQSLELAASLLRGVPAAAGRCAECRELLRKGVETSEAIRASQLLPPSACRLLALGIRSGSGDTAMSSIAARLAEDADSALVKKIARIEPTMVLLASLLIGAILLSVMFPLMDIMTAIG